MNELEIDWEDNGCGTLPTQLKGYFSFFIALNVIGLSGAVFLLNGPAIGVTLISLVFHGLMLAAIIKQWRDMLNIGKIILYLGVVLPIIGIVLDTKGLFDMELIAREAHENVYYSYTVRTIILMVALFSNLVLAVLVGAYATRLTKASKAKTFNAKPFKMEAPSMEKVVHHM